MNKFQILVLRALVVVIRLQFIAIEDADRLLSTRGDIKVDIQALKSTKFFNSIEKLLTDITETAKGV